MTSPRQEPFPFQAARDLLGILRAMYGAARNEGSDRRRLLAIRRVGEELRAAIDLALEHDPGTLGHAAAWTRAERATRELGDLCDVTTPLAPTLGAAASRLVVRRAPGSQRDDGRRARRARG